MNRLLFQLAVLPAVFLIWYIYRKDKAEKEPAKLLVRLFVLGALVCIVVAFIEVFASAVLGVVIPESTVMYAFLENFYAVALVEELAKYFVLKKSTWSSAHFDYLFDGVVYAVVASLGFATFENVFYVASGGVSTAIARALLSVPGHAIDGVCMGYFYGLAKRADLRGDATTRGKNLFLAVLGPTAIHGVYDFLISVDLFGVFLLFEVVVTILAVLQVNKLSREDAPL